MFLWDIFKKVKKVISKFFLFNEGIRRSEESRGIRQADDGGGEDVRVLSNSNSDDGDDNNGGEGGGGDDDNNGATIMLMEELIVLRSYANIEFDIRPTL